jgi:hypothetical protein
VADEPQPETAAEQSPEAELPEESHGGGVTLEGLNAKVDDLIGRLGDLLRGGQNPRARATKADDAAEVAEQVRTEVRKLGAEEKKEAARTGRLDQLEEAVKKLTERAPVEYRRITTILWGDPDE